MGKVDIVFMLDRLVAKYGHGLTVGKLYDWKVLADLDQEFYQNFAGKYYQGLPVNYVIQRGHVDHNINATDALTAAIGNGVTQCLGYFAAFDCYDAPESPVRRWVEINDAKNYTYVLEPAWGLAIKRDMYYAIFGVKVAEQQTYQDWVAAHAKDPAAVTCYTREDYEERGVALNPNVVQAARDDANITLRSTRDPQVRADAERLLAALPDLTKCQNLVVPHLKRLSQRMRLGIMPREHYGDMILDLNPQVIRCDNDNIIK